MGSPAAAWGSAASNSEADWKRFDGSFSRQRRTTASSAGGTGRMLEGGVTGSWTCR